MERSGGLDVLAAFTEQGAVHAGHPDHRVRRRHRRDGGDPAGRLRLRLEAVQRRGAAPDGGARAGAASGWSPSRRPSPRESKTHLQDIVGKSAVMLEVYKLVARVAAIDGDGAGRGRVGHRQGAGGARDPHAFAARRGAVRAGQLHGADRVAAGVGAVRPRARRLHRRGGGQARPVRDGRTAARCSSTRSATWGRRCRPSCCARCRTARSGRWAAANRSGSTCGWCARPTRTWTRR